MPRRKRIEKDCCLRIFKMISKGKDHLFIEKKLNVSGSMIENYIAKNMDYFKSIWKRTCDCGCGEITKVGNYFILGHWARLKNPSTRPEVKEMRRQAIKSLLWQAKKYWKDPQHRKEQSVKLKKAWSNPVLKEKMRGYTRQRNIINWKDPEYRKNRSERFIGPRNPMWCGGINKEKYPLEFNAYLKKYVRGRDNFLCQWCHVKENGKKHSVHHIDYNKLNNSLTNLILLCNGCHTKTTVGDRVVWKRKLTDLQSKRKFLLRREYNKPYKEESESLQIGSGKEE